MRARNQQWDGLPASRATRRILTLLLTGASNLDGWTIASLSGIMAARAYGVLDQLERADWVESEWDQRGMPVTSPRRRFYRLTARGRYMVPKMLGLEFGGIPSKDTESGEES
jgi:hypothetical protein